MKKVNIKIITAISIAATIVMSVTVLSYNQINAGTKNQNNSHNYDTINNNINISDIQDPSNDEILLPVIDRPDNIQKLDLQNTNIKIPLDLAEQDVSSFNKSNVSSSDNLIASLVEVRGTHNGQSNEVIAFYQLADGKHEMIVSQTDNIYGGISGAIEAIKPLYDPNDLKIENYENHSIVIEDSTIRKHVHVITDQFFFTVASPGTLDLDLLLAVSNLIELK